MQNGNAKNVTEPNFRKKFFPGRKCRKYAGKNGFGAFSQDFIISFFWFFAQGCVLIMPKIWPNPARPVLITHDSFRVNLIKYSNLIGSREYNCFLNCTRSQPFVPTKKVYLSSVVRYICLQEVLFNFFFNRTTWKTKWQTCVQMLFYKIKSKCFVYFLTFYQVTSNFV